MSAEVPATSTRPATDGWRGCMRRRIGYCRDLALRPAKTKGARNPQIDYGMSGATAEITRDDGLPRQWIGIEVSPFRPDHTRASKIGSPSRAVGVDRISVQILPCGDVEGCPGVYDDKRTE